MPKAESFILTSDFATLKNDNAASVSITVPGSTVTPPASAVTFSADLTVGTPGAEQRIRVQSDLLGSQYYTGVLRVARTGSGPFGAAFYSVYTMVARISPTVVRCSVVIPNPYIDPITGISQAETFTFSLNTFLSPVG